MPIGCTLRSGRRPWRPFGVRGRPGEELRNLGDSSVAGRLRVAGWTLVAVLCGLLLVPVVVSPFVTAVPAWLALGLGAAAFGLVWVLRRTVRGGARRATLVLVGFAIVAVLAVWLSQTLARTPPIVDDAGHPIPESIATLETVELNGSRQWVTIRGRDRSNPVLLFLAGGPGGSELPSTRIHLGRMEDHFVVVNWDQPGAGKSFGAVPAASLTPERYVADALSLVDHLRTRFGVEKVYLLGESWGTILGVWLVRDHPERFHAYVGSGQMVSTVENDRLGYELALRVLSEKGQIERRAALVAAGPPPYTAGNLSLRYAAYLGVLNEFMAERMSEEARRPDILLDALRAPEYGLWDKVNWIRGLMAVFNAVYPQLSDVDLAYQAPELRVPVVFLVGRHDRNAMADLAREYFEALEAPYKELVWFEDSGHPPLYSEADKVIDILVGRVLGPRDGPAERPQGSGTAAPDRRARGAVDPRGPAEYTRACARFGSQRLAGVGQAVPHGMNREAEADHG